MRERTQEILKATAEAARVIDQVDLDTPRTNFDIIGLVSHLEIPLMFRPLQKLWGASVVVDGEHRGILVTTALDLPVQRFTLAHELGHILMNHKSSYDQTTGFAGKFGPASVPTQEIAADTFASELLAPKSLVLASAQRHQWTKKHLGRPEVVYQLSLRLGISYIAACWALANRKIISAADAKKLASETVKDLKTALVPKTLINNPWANTWRLSPADTGTFLEAGPDDVFALYLKENASAGYLWQIVDTGSSAQIIGEQNAPPDAFGESTSRVLFLKFKEPGKHRLAFEHRRPWNKSTIEHIEISVDCFGKEQGGYSRHERLLALAEGAA